MKFIQAVLACALAASPAAAAPEGFKLKEVPAASGLDIARLEPRTVYFSQRPAGEPSEGDSGLIRFEDWARERAVEKRILSLYPGYAEPTITVSVHGLPKRHQEKLHMFVVEARFALAKPAHAIPLERYVSLAFLERIDPAIRHKPLAPDRIAPLSDPESAHNIHPNRKWCEERPHAICIQSHYQLEGKLPLGIRLANKLEEGGKKIAEHIAFQSELRLLSGEEAQRLYPDLALLTRLDAPVHGVLEQSIFHVNQIMQFGKFLVVVQSDPANPNRTIVTAYMALAIETDVLAKKKEFETVPVLRNLVPSQVLLGNSSFNTGRSISAGLPDYARNQLRTVAGILEQE